MAYQYVLSSVQSSEGRTGKSLSDEEILKVVEKEIKSLNEMVSVGNAKNSEDIMASTLSKLLPEKVSVDQYETIVRSTAKTLRVTSVKDMGKVMSEIKKVYGSTVDGKLMSDVVKKILTSI